MNVLAVVPARAGSKGVLHKNVRPVAGWPLLGWSLHAALESSRVTHVAVTSDSAHYLGVVDELVEQDLVGLASELRGFGGRERVLRIVRPAHLATDQASTDETIAHAIHEAEAVTGLRYDLVVLLQPTVPVRSPGLVDECIERLLVTRADCLFTVNRAHFVWQPFAGSFISSTGNARPRRQDFSSKDDRWLEDGSVYVSRRYMFDSIPPLRISGRIELFETERTVDIDTEEDLVIAEALLRHRARVKAALQEAS